MADTLNGGGDTAARAGANPLSRKVAKILDNQLENDQETLEALKELSTFFKENTIRTRRNLRGEIEGRNLAINQDIFQTFDQIKVALDDVLTEVTVMDQNCRDAARRLAATKGNTRHLLSQMAAFQTANKQLAMEEAVSTRTLDELQLSADELLELRGGSDRPVTVQFFAALDKAQRAHQRCRQLLQSGHRTTLFEIMEQMALFQEAALERLYRWTQAACRNVESPDSNLLLAQAIGCLQDHPVLLKYVVDEYCTARRSVVVRSFLDALTVGGPHGTPRPMEVHAHDPPRYVSDMLAWLHQMAPTEKENVQALLKGCDRSDVAPLVTAALSNITEGVCRPLRVRLEQVMEAETGPAVLHTVSGLLRFYVTTMADVVGDTALMETLRDLDGQCRSTCLAALEASASRLVERLAPPPADLGPSAVLSPTLQLLRDVLSGGRIADAGADDVARVVERTVRPLLDAVQRTAARLPVVDQAAYTLNCLYQVHSSLSLYQYVDEWLQQLQDQMDAHLARLTSEQTSSLIHSLGLGPVCSLLQPQAQPQSRQALADLPGMDPSSLHSFLVKLDALLAAPDALQLPQWRLLISGSHRKTIQRRALDSVLHVYGQLYAAVHDPANGYQNPGQVMPRTPQQVSALLA